MLQGAADRAFRVAEDEPLARAGHRDVQQPAHVVDVLGARVGGELLVQERVGDRLGHAPPRAGHARRLQAEDEHVAELAPLRGVHGQHADGAVAALAGALLLVVVQAGLGHRRHVACEVAPGGLRRAAHVGGGQVAEARERDEALDDVGLCGEELLAAQPEAVDEAVHEEVGARGVEGAGGRAVQLEEAQDALARLGRQLGRLGGGHQRADHVELAPARDLHAARDVDRPQLDRRAREGAHHGAGVAGIDEQAQPGEHVLDLGALEERGRAGQAVGHGAFLEGHGDRLTLVAHRAHQHADVLRRHAGAHEPLDLGRRALRLGALVGAAPEAHAAAGGRVGRLVDAPLDRLHHGLRGVQDGGRRAQRALQAHGVRAGQRGGQVAQVPGRRAAPAAHRAVVVARGGQPAVLAAQGGDEAQPRELEVLGVVDEHVAPARRDPRAHVGLVVQQGDGAQEQVAEVQRALLAQHAVVGLVEPGELALALGALVALRAGRRPSARPRRR